jgi:two-component system sensor histidine kinase/response regulator
MLEMVKMHLLDTETQTTILNDISKRVEDVYDLLDNLLRWAKSQMQGIVLTPVIFDVQKEVNTVVENLTSVAENKLISLKANVERQSVFADKDLFSVVVRNLVSNAIKFTTKGGEVKICSEISDNKLIISVKDRGTGIPKNVQEHLFKISETVSLPGTNNEKGTGLGLLLCYDFAKANGGEIWFTSEEGAGSTFSFSVPIKKS